jgi:hypothetical protein
MVSRKIKHISTYLFMCTKENVHGNTVQLYVHYSIYDAYSTQSPSCEELVVARDLQLTPGPLEYLASASQGPPAYSQALGVPS